MSKTSTAVDSLPAASLKALQRLGADLTLARQRRKESRNVWAQRMNVSVPTLIRMEKGEPTVAIGVYATAFWLLGRTEALSTLANPQYDLGALQRDVQLASKRHARNITASNRA